MSSCEALRVKLDADAELGDWIVWIQKFGGVLVLYVMFKVLSCVH